MTHGLIGMLWLVMIFASLSGCALTNETHRVFSMAKRTTHLEPRFYEYVRSDRVAQREARLLAEQAWSEAQATMSNPSRDYENGFVEGFADYLYRGGTGEPPVIPPRGYWHLRFLNQFGKRSIHDWYDGFRDGAENCKARGIREMWIIPSSLLTEAADVADAADAPVETDLPASPETPRAEPHDQPKPDSATDIISDRDAGDLPEPSPLPDAGDAPEQDLNREDMGSQPAATGTPSTSETEGDPDELPESMDPAQPPDSPQPIDPPTDVDPFQDDAQPETEEDIFKLPTDEDLELDLESPLPDGDPFSIRWVSPPSPITASTAVRTEQEAIRRISADVEVEDAQGPPAREVQRPKALRKSTEVRNPYLPSPSSRQVAPLPLLLEPSKLGVPPLPARSTRLSPQDAAIEESFQTREFSPSSPPPPQAASRPLPKSRPRQAFAEELQFDDSLPALPLHVAQPPLRDEITQWDPMEGIEPPRDLDFGEVVYDDVISNDAIAESTQWTAEMSRARELPLRIPSPRTTPAGALETSAGKSKADVAPSTLKMKHELKSVLDQHARRNESLPRIINRRDLPATNDSPPMQWRIQD